MKSDNEKILSGSDMGVLTLYDKDNSKYEGRGRWTNIGLDFNPQGQPVASKKWTIAFHIDSFSTITSADETYKTWQAEFINSQGETIRGVLNNPLVDKTLGYVLATLTEIKPVVPVVV
jgi:hypothetical protein